jgi:hypothetical protein
MPLLDNVLTASSAGTAQPSPGAAYPHRRLLCVAGQGRPGRLQLHLPVPAAVALSLQGRTDVTGPRGTTVIAGGIAEN